MKNKMNCQVIKDLLPLYHDGVVSEESKKLVEAHLKECEECIAEYETLSADLPLEKVESTKEDFRKLQVRKKIKRVIISITASVVAVALLIVGYFWQLYDLPIANVPSREMEVQRVYHYTTKDGEDGLYIQYKSLTTHNGTKTWKIKVKGGKNGTLIINEKRPLFCWVKKAKAHKWTIAFTGESGTYCPGEKLVIRFGSSDYEKVKLGSKVIWDKEKDNDVEAPAWVLAYDEYENGNKIENFTFADDFVAAGYRNGRTVKWDYEGNVISDEKKNKLDKK